LFLKPRRTSLTIYSFSANSEILRLMESIPVAAPQVHGQHGLNSKYVFRRHSNTGIIQLTFSSVDSVAQARVPTSESCDPTIHKNIKTHTNFVDVSEHSRRTCTSGRNESHGTMSDVAVRKAFLQQDQWAWNVEPRSVTCGGCNQTIMSDKRMPTYSTGLWLKHRATCRYIGLGQMNTGNGMEVRTDLLISPLS
jgi:hypothetical protein